MPSCYCAHPRRPEIDRRGTLDRQQRHHYVGGMLVQSVQVRVHTIRSVSDLDVQALTCSYSLLAPSVSWPPNRVLGTASIERQVEDPKAVGLCDHIC